MRNSEAKSILWTRTCKSTTICMFTSCGVIFFFFFFFLKKITIDTQYSVLFLPIARKEYFYEQSSDPNGVIQTYCGRGTKGVAETSYLPISRAGCTFGTYA